MALFPEKRIYDPGKMRLNPGLWILVVPCNFIHEAIGISMSYRSHLARRYLCKRANLILWVIDGLLQSLNCVLIRSHLLLSHTFPTSFSGSIKRIAITPAVMPPGRFV